MYVPNFTSTKIQGYKAKIKENASLSFFSQSDLQPATPYF